MQIPTCNIMNCLQKDRELCVTYNYLDLEPDKY